jgi:hypothetical protein
MNEHIQLALLGTAAVCGGAIALSIFVKFLWWLVSALWRQANILINGTTQFLIHIVTMFATTVNNLVGGLLALLWNMLTTAFLIPAQPVKVFSIRIGKAAHDYAKLRQLYWKYGYTNFKSFKAFKRHMRGEEEPQQKKPEHKEGSFEEALEIMGFTDGQSLTQTDLKARYRQLISTLHPDKGFPNRLFAQQVNNAFALIMQVKKWK